MMFMTGNKQIDKLIKGFLPYLLLHFWNWTVYPTHSRYYINAC